MCYSGGHELDPPKRQHSFVEIGHEINPTAILSLPLIQVNHWQKNVHQVLVNRLRLSLPRKSVARLTDSLDMTIVAE